MSNRLSVFVAWGLVVFLPFVIPLAIWLSGGFSDWKPLFPPALRFWALLGVLAINATIFFAIGRPALLRRLVFVVALSLAWFMAIDIAFLLTEMPKRRELVRRGVPGTPSVYRDIPVDPADEPTTQDYLRWGCVLVAGWTAIVVISGRPSVTRYLATLIEQNE
jgi:hypothetical protein